MEKPPTTILDHFTPTIGLPNDGGSGYRSYQVAGAGGRFLAGLVDFILQVASFAVLAWLAVRTRPDLFPPESWAWAIPVGFVEWHIIYLMLFESFTRGATPGKALMKLRVVSETGSTAGIIALVLRNLGRILDLLLFLYVGAFVMISLGRRRQRIGDMLGHTAVVYGVPLVSQMDKSEVPESMYSTSEDGYLLEAWVEREQRLDGDSRIASAIDLAMYLHTKYGGPTDDLPDPVIYLRNLYKAERHDYHVDQIADEVHAE